MDDSWKHFEPSPIEFFHGKLMELFHDWRKEKYGISHTTVPIDGIELSNIIARAKIITYEKYKKLNLNEAIHKDKL